FITATDTDAGKTWLTSHWIQALLRQGVDAQALKPVACGVHTDGINEDVALLARVQGMSNPQHINAHTFTMPSAPSLAAQAEKKEVNPQALCDWCIKKMTMHDVTLIEGIGGLMVPLVEQYLVMDWLQDLADCQVVLVVGAKLGCINHAILSLKQLQYQQRPPAYIIINDATGQQDVEAIRQAMTPYIHKNTQVFQSVHAFCAVNMHGYMAKK
ncbi:MAG: dethiobiotin synthase, partial [Mariprofundaceae bacterium]|nr:dethiobiotin synthase [Mariprofundaceae bacterium]